MYEHVYLVGHPKPESQDPNFKLDFIDGFKLPEGYLEYFQELGRGEFCGYINVFPQQDLAKQYQFWIELLDDGADEFYCVDTPFPVEAARHSIYIADAFEGSMLFFHPLTDTFYFADRGSLEISKIEGDFLDALRSFMLSVSYDPRKFSYFLAEDVSSSIFHFEIEKKSYEEVNQAILDLQLHSNVNIQDPYSRFTLPQLAGIIIVDKTSSYGSSVSLYGDRKLNPNLTDRLADEFQAMGFYETLSAYTRSTDVDT